MSAQPDDERIVAPDVTSRSLHELIDLRGQVAFVTGGARGIGGACARRLAEAGAHVVVADLDATGAAAAAESLVAGGWAASGVGLQVTDTAAVDAAIEEGWERHGPIRIVVNAAGVFMLQPFLEVEDDTWERIMSINLAGVMKVSRAVCRRLVAAGLGGVVVNISSASSLRAHAGVSPYAAAKSGMNGLTMTMAHELGPSGIRVLGVAPTTIDTPGIAELRQAHHLGDGVLPGQRTVPPLGRYGVADDVARVVLFCASDLSSLMTGVTLPIDAGVTLA